MQLYNAITLLAFKKRTNPPQSFWVPTAPACPWIPCANPGNPVFSCMLDAKTVTSSNFLTKPRLLLYKTTSGEYGAIPPTSPMVPCKFYPRNNAFTTHVLACGLAQYNCINTGLDKTRVCDHSELCNTL
uniref:Uncharacterized protein n=1 Tax=Salvator merianae TaxID=96440 RepID=A0A8D0B619_SALMN